MQKETLMETSVPVETSVSIEQAGTASTAETSIPCEQVGSVSSVENPTSSKQAGTVSHGESPTSGRRAKPAVPVGNPFAVCVKIITRLDALKEYVLGYMDTERYRNANLAESRPDDAPVALDESEQVLSDLRRIAGRAGLESAIAEREFAANFLGFSNSVPKVPTPDGAVLDAIAANRKKIVTRLVALRQRAFDGMGAEQAGPILEDLRYVAEYTGLEEEIAWKEETMAYSELQCPFCGSLNVSRAERSKNGTQRYFCHNSACSHKTFQLEYRYMAYSPGVREKARRMLMGGSNKNDTGRALNISWGAVDSVMRKRRELSGR